MADKKETSTPDTNPPTAGFSSRSVRARFARRMTGNRNHVAPALEPLIAVHRGFHPNGDVELLDKAYRTAERLHAGVYRKSGDPYITHPLAVANIAAEIGMDSATLAAALLHDTVEDTDYTLDELTADFGAEIAAMVDGVTKLDRVALGSAAEAETIRKMIIAMANDPRVLVIKVADRLHNMRTMRFLPPEKQEKKARQTLEVIAPLAARLGMSAVKWELEDLSFRILYPRQYAEIVRLVSERAPSRERYLSEVIQAIESTLEESNIYTNVYGRPKHYWSIYQKMIVRGREFDEIYDLVGVRVICKNIRDCYAAVGVIHSMWQPMPGRFKDYIAQPRFGVYQSLHTTVVGPQGKALEVQIRTEEMHQTAEYGIAAHWRYKETKGSHTGDSRELNRMAWMRQLLDWQREAADPGEFLETLRYDLAVKEIFVFTPKGDVINLPTGSTPIDFAYSVHTEVGHHCIGARVNGKLVPLEKVLKNGDVVEVFTSKDPSAGPSRDWLDFVVSGRAKNKIRQWFAKERREETIEAGKDAITREIRRGGLPLHRLLNNESMALLIKDLNFADASALYKAVGSGNITAGHVVSRLVSLFGSMEEAEETLTERTSFRSSHKPTQTTDDAGVLVDGMPGISVKLSKCCTPVPGDQIIGYITRMGSVSVHRKDCPNAIHMLEQKSHREVPVKWAASSSAVFLVCIQVEALDRQGLLSDVTKTLSESRVDVVSAQVQTLDDRVAISKWAFQIADPKRLTIVLNAVRQVEGVYDVYRINSL